MSEVATRIDDIRRSSLGGGDRQAPDSAEGDEPSL
jgi:hypothetical protein